MLLLNNKKVGFIGAGAMAEAILKGLLEIGILTASQCMLSDISEQRLQYLSNQYGVSVTQDNLALVKHSDILILAVKPQIIGKVLDEIAPTVDKRTLVISIAAGICLSRLEETLQGVRVLRVMPNTPVAVSAGMAAISLGNLATKEDGQLAVKLFEAVGRAVIIAEDLMDGVTGLSGSGPGYAFVIIDALADAGVLVGLNRQTAILLAAQTLMGAAKMVLETGEHPAKLRDMVTSPAGTTIAGIHVLEQNGLRTALIDAVVEASKRSSEMNK
ncbi:pyrroline-5-carboxylate reductase [Anaerosporomusa subterranea]|uniref:pyrroline-5-carboxylate reductase n=1 Tax=Anaerosporomusa subterranea TaxID=1794912 RepID=UPI000A5A445B